MDWLHNAVWGDGCKHHHLYLYDADGLYRDASAHSAKEARDIVAFELSSHDLRRAQILRNVGICEPLQVVAGWYRVAGLYRGGEWFVSVALLRDMHGGE